mgnify:FL=1
MARIDINKALEIYEEHYNPKFEIGSYVLKI